MRRGGPVRALTETFVYDRFISTRQTWGKEISKGLFLGRHFPGQVGDQVFTYIDLEEGQYQIWVYGVGGPWGGCISISQDLNQLCSFDTYLEKEGYLVRRFDAFVGSGRRRLFVRMESEGRGGGTEFWGEKVVFILK
jgi:hypothetical protein